MAATPARVLSALDPPIDVPNGGPVHVRASIGSALLPTTNAHLPDATIEKALHQADVALASQPK